MKTGDPRTVLGMPAYNRPDTLPRVLESLLSQTSRDFALVIVDDAPSPRVREIVDSYAGYGVQITYEPNPVRLGMIGNWRKAFTRARELYPNSEYFAWVSDHTAGIRDGSRFSRVFSTSIQTSFSRIR